MTKTSILFAFSLLPAISFAQETRRRPPLNAPPPSVAPPVPGRVGNRPATAHPSGLEENITLHLQGNFQGFVPLDLELSGNGQNFSIDFIKKAEKEGDQPTIISFTATVTQAPDHSYQSSFNLGARIALVSSSFRNPGPGGSTTRNFEYRDLALSGTAKLTEGQPLVISKLNGEDLILTISKAKK